MSGPRLLGRLALLGAVTLAGCTSRTDERNAIRRGDEAFALGNLEQALAEYRLALRQGADDPETFARVAHTYVELGRVDAAGAMYAAAVEGDSAMADQAVADMLLLARQARERDDRFAMAIAVETALAFRPGLGVGEMALPLARHYFRNGEYGRALPFYQKALAESDSPTADVVFEVGQAYEESGDCAHALPFFERFREMARPAQRGEVDWYIGSCSFAVARALRERPTPELAEVPVGSGGGGEGASPDDPSEGVPFEGGNAATDAGTDEGTDAGAGEASDSLGAPVTPFLAPQPRPLSPAQEAEYRSALVRALAHLDRVLEVGEPRNLLGQVWFEKGEILSDLGRCDEAMEAFSQVRFTDPSGPLVERAQSRFDEILAGRGLEQFRGGRCR